MHGTIHTLPVISLYVLYRRKVYLSRGFISAMPPARYDKATDTRGSNASFYKEDSAAV